MAMSPRAAHHGDDIIADLPTFLEMATHEDPMDDFALFFKNACRWARYERVIQVGPEGTFYPFAALPDEIRWMIWEVWIPNQIHLVAELVDEDDYLAVAKEVSDAMRGELDALNYCHFPCYMGSRVSRQKTPVIAKVNQESRELALKHKSKGYNLAIVREFPHRPIDRIQESALLLDKKYDTVLINTQLEPATRYPTDAVFRTEDGKLDHKEDRLMGMATRNTIQVAIFAAVFIDKTPPFHIYDALTTAKRVDLVVGSFSFYDLPDSEAAVTGFFGLSGEQSMGLVPADNPRSLRKLYTAHAAFDPRR